MILGSNSCITPDIKEQKQIQTWKRDNRFYSENRLSLQMK